MHDGLMSDYGYENVSLTPSAEDDLPHDNAAQFMSGKHNMEDTLP